MALFIWGEKEVLRRLGFVADFCPLCRGLRAFEVSRVGIAGHLYYISLVEGRLAGYRMTCQGCKTDFQAEPETYAALLKEPLPPMQLAAKTFPNWRTLRAERLETERQIADPFTRLPAKRRLELIREPFKLLAPRVEKRFGQALVMDGPTFATAVAALAAIGFGHAWLKEARPPHWEEILAGIFALGLAAVVVQIGLTRGRYFRNIIFPILVPALKPLRPTREELESVLHEMKQLRVMIARKVNVGALLAALKVDIARKTPARDDNEVETKIELAAACIEQGDRDGAREILTEVAGEPAASPSQKDRARQMAAHV